MPFVTIARERLRAAGYDVVPTNIPGLWDVPGIANDVTTGQLHDIADRHGAIIWYPPYPKVLTSNIS